VAQILGSPYAVADLSDGGAYVQFHSNVSNPIRLLGHWVRKEIMACVVLKPGSRCTAETAGHLT